MIRFDQWSDDQTPPILVMRVPDRSSIKWEAFEDGSIAFDHDSMFERRRRVGDKLGNAIGLEQKIARMHEDGMISLADPAPRSMRDRYIPSRRPSVFLKREPVEALISPKLWDQLKARRLTRASIAELIEQVGKSVPRMGAGFANPARNRRRTEFVRPDYIEPRLDAFIEKFNEQAGASFARSSLLMAEYLSIHPANDGNGRVARTLLSAHLLSSAGVIMQVLPLGPAMYANAPHYISAIRRLDTTGYSAPFLQVMERLIEIAVTCIEIVSSNGDQCLERCRELRLGHSSDGRGQDGVLWSDQLPALAVSPVSA